MAKIQSNDRFGIIETAFGKTGVLTILLDAESAVLPLVIDLTELLDCHVCHIRDRLKYRAKVRTKSQVNNTGFTDGLLSNHLASMQVCTIVQELNLHIFRVHQEWPWLLFL